MALSLVLFIAVLQGATELFPVSSLGHAVVVPAMFGLDFRPTDPSFVPFLVLLHLGTATALFILYWRDWKGIIAGFVRAAIRGSIQTDAERLAMLLVVATVPAGLVGVVLETPLKKNFGSPRFAATLLIVNGLMLGATEVLRRRADRRHGGSRATQESALLPAERLSFRAAIAVGLCQVFSLFPGISRSGITMAGGLVAGLRHQEAARLSFLMATPIIAAAGVLDVPQLFSTGIPIGRYVLGAVVSGLIAYASARFLVRYLRVGRLDPFAAYCAVIGAAGLIIVH